MSKITTINTYKHYKILMLNLNTWRIEERSSNKQQTNNMKNIAHFPKLHIMIAIFYLYPLDKYRIYFN